MKFFNPPPTLLSLHLYLEVTSCDWLWYRGGRGGGVPPSFPAPVPGSDPPVTGLGVGGVAPCPCCPCICTWKWSSCDWLLYGSGRGGSVAPAFLAPVPGSDPPVTDSDVEVGGAGVWHLLSLHLYLEVILLWLTLMQRWAGRGWCTWCSCTCTWKWSSFDWLWCGGGRSGAVAPAAPSAEILSSQPWAQSD
jgi:hypothetical protein